MTTVRGTSARLRNGLTVHVRPLPGCQIVASCLHVGTGFRNERIGGAAHLLEHVLSQGSASIGRLSSAVAAVGGAANARTAADYTHYTQILPAAGLSTGLRIERERLTDPDFSTTNVDAQREVVRAEIRRNVLQRPHGGLVLFDLPELLHDSWADRHNGYGDIDALRSLDADVLRPQFETGYAPANIHLALVGDLDPQRTMDEAAELFDAVPARMAPVPEPEPEREPEAAGVSRGGQLLAARDGRDPEPPLSAPRTAERSDAFATDCRTVWGFRAPDPTDEPDDYLAVVLLSELVDGTRGSGDAAAGDHKPFHGRVQRTGKPFDVAHGSLFAVDCVHPRSTPADRIESGLRRAFAELASDGSELPHLLDTLRGHFDLQLNAELDSAAALASWVCVGAAVHGRPEFLSELPERINTLPVAAVRRLAARYAAEPVARITSTPATAGGAE